jgi:predicted GIY-YIG superfamily endonuclease
MSAMKPMIPKLDSVDSIYNYLRESSPTEVVSSTTPSSTRDSTRINNQLKSTKKQKKEKETTNRMNNTHTNSKELIQTLPSGRVK